MSRTWMSIFAFLILTQMASAQPFTEPNFKSEDPYEILGVPNDADLETVNKQFKRLAVIYHPDKSRGTKDQFQALSNARDQIVQLTKVIEFFKEMNIQEKVESAWINTRFWSEKPTQEEIRILGNYTEDQHRLIRTIGKKEEFTRDLIPIIANKVTTPEAANLIIQVIEQKFYSPKVWRKLDRLDVQLRQRAVAILLVKNVFRDGDVTGFARAFDWVTEFKTSNQLYIFAKAVGRNLDPISVSEGLVQYPPYAETVQLIDANPYLYHQELITKKSLEKYNPLLEKVEHQRQYHNVLKDIGKLNDNGKIQLVIHRNMGLIGKMMDEERVKRGKLFAAELKKIYEVQAKYGSLKRWIDLANENNSEAMADLVKYVFIDAESAYYFELDHRVFGQFLKACKDELFRRGKTPEALKQYNRLHEITKTPIAASLKIAPHKPDNSLIEILDDPCNYLLW